MNTREFRVYGPPGTGKTRYVSEQAKRAAEKYGPSGVAIASLTRAAAAEIASRIEGVPDRNVGTLHSAAWHALGRPKIVEATDGIKAWNDHVNTPRWKIGDQRVLDPENAPAEAPMIASDGDRLLSQMNVYRQRMMPRELWRTDVLRFAREWDRFKESIERLDFTDLIERAIEDIERHPSIPQALFLDEAQDMSKLEMTLARKWGSRCDVFVIVGDPFQNLYEWRGSDPEAFTAGEISGEIVLDQSYRVPKAVHRYAVDWIHNVVKAGEKFPDYMPTDVAGDVHVAPHTWNFPEPLIASFERDIEEGKTVMLLASCGFMLNPVIAVLRDRGIPFHNPYRAAHGGWNPLRWSSRLLAFLKPQTDVYGDDAAMWTWQDLWEFVEVMKARGVVKRGEKQYVEMMAEEKNFGELAHTEPISAAKLLTVFEEDALDRIFAGDLDWLCENVLDSRRRVIDYPAAIAKKYGGAKLLEAPNVIVGTIHSVKGGQADRVYVFPDLSRQGMEGWTRYGATRDAIYRQFYVAFTRARERLILLQPNGHETVMFPRPKEKA